jgi:hypothetical protein
MALNQIRGNVLVYFKAVQLNEVELYWSLQRQFIFDQKVLRLQQNLAQFLDLLRKKM